MVPGPLTDVALRPYRPGADARATWQVFHDAVHGTAARWYAPAQLRAWAPEDVDLDRWDARRRSACTVVAEDARGAVVGFADLTADGVLDLLFVHPDAGGRGVGRALVQRVLDVAETAGHRRVAVRASLAARPLLERCGFVLDAEREVEVRGQRLRSDDLSVVLPRPAPDPLSALPWPLRTARTTLRRATPDDLDAQWAYRGLAATSRWTGWRPADAADFRAASATRLATTVLVEVDGRLVGDLQVRVHDGWAQREVREAARGVEAELGWVLDPAATGRGYAAEAVRAVLRACFAELGLRRVTAQVFAANTASCRLAERVGMRREAHGRRDSLHRDEGWVDGVTYALLAEEWTAGRGVVPPTPDR